MCWIHCVVPNNRAEMWKRKNFFLTLVSFFPPTEDAGRVVRLIFRSHMDNFSQSSCFLDSHLLKEKLVWDKVAFVIKKKFFACGALDEVTFSLILKDSLLTLTHMVKCALIWCRFSLGTFALFFSRSAFFLLPRLAGGEGFSFSLTMGFPFLSIFFTMLAWKTCWSGMGNDWWIRERGKKVSLVHEDSSSHVSSFFISHEKATQRLKIPKKDILPSCNIFSHSNGMKTVGMKRKPER